MWSSLNLLHFFLSTQCPFFPQQVSIFEASGSSIQSNIAAIILGVVNIVATIGANLLIDRLGRKMLLYISGTFP